MKRLVLTMVVLGLLAGPGLWAGEGRPAEAEPVEAEPTTAPATQEAPKEKTPAEACYAKIVAHYIKGQWSELAETLRKDYRKHGSKMTRDQRKDVLYIRKMAPRHRPSWWKYTKSSSNKSFRARIWNRTITANYVPSGFMGGQMPVDIIKGKLQVIVTWRPALVDDPDPATGKLAKLHGFTKGHIGEAIIWHELGHNYISSFLPLKHVITLYVDHGMLFRHLHEFYADMTSLYHCSPPARLVAMMLRLDGLDSYRRRDEHTRAGLAIGSLLLTQFLTKPENWPSIHFPPKVPDRDIERRTVIYVYEHIDPGWTVAEDRALVDFIGKYIRTRGESVLRKKGVVPLPNKLAFALMANDDREYEPKREAWIKEHLERIIKSSRADKPKPTTRKAPRFEEKLRIGLPWDD